MELFNSKDIQRIKEHGFSPENAQQNIATFEKGIPHVNLVAPATLEKGIRKLSEKKLERLVQNYEKSRKTVVKFVPASGAATRMFKILHEFLAEFDLKKDELEQVVQNSKFSALETFFKNISSFAFYGSAVEETKKHHPNFERFSEDEKKYRLVETLMAKDKLNFSELPKGLVPFHKYADETRTAFEEHLVEAREYGTDEIRVDLHFTVAEKHLGKFREKHKQAMHFYPEGKVNYSFQQKSTDTLAVDLDNKPFRGENGNLLFRPAGHGALLENLDQMDADIVFIKNIDNVSTEKNLKPILKYKKALAGLLLEIQEETFELIQELEHLKESKKQQHSELAPNILKEAKVFLKEKLNVATESESPSELIRLLDRPVRICGMVRNQGAPGGGPFWTKNPAGEISLQIVETAQIDLKNPQQKAILDAATHFNPVDLVCGTKNHRGEKFDLQKYSNPENGFISQKSIGGKALKALELPGLWNGAMENWNSVFVEVPLKTFNPVKTILDVLNENHS